MKKYFCLPTLLLLLVLASPALRAGELELTPGERAVGERLSPEEFTVTTIRLWPKEAPDEPRPLPDESATEGARGGLRIMSVTEPSITVARPKSAEGAVPAILICPGGGYGSLGIDSGGVDIVKFLQPFGVAGVYLKYRVPKRHNDYPMHYHPLQDIQRAVCILRSRADELQIDPDRIGAIGFSAGGHLVAMLATNGQPEDRLYKPIDAADEERFRLNFAALVAPAYLTMPIPSADLDPALQVDKIARNITPPVFITSAVTDKFTIGSCHFLLALREKRVPADMHIYEQGGHAEGIHEGPNNQWPAMFADWLKRKGIVAAE